MKRLSRLLKDAIGGCFNAGLVVISTVLNIILNIIAAIVATIVQIMIKVFCKPITIVLNIILIVVAILVAIVHIIEKIIDCYEAMTGSCLQNNRVESLSTITVRPPVTTDDPLAKYLWYHGRISNEEADGRLRGHSIDGAYLVYVNKQNQYVLLVFHQGNHYRWKICKTKDGNTNMYVLGEDKPTVTRYRTIQELIKAHRGIQGKPIRVDENHVVTLSKSYVSRLQSSGARSKDQMVEVTKKDSGVTSDCGNLINKLWYHGQISNKTAEDRLIGDLGTDEDQLKGGAGGGRIVDGAYLVYDNPDDNPDQYILLVYYQGKPLRWKIIKSSTDSMYVLGEGRPGVPKYHTVKELIKAHRGVQGEPIRVDRGHVVTLSKTYISRPVKKQT